MSGAANDTSMVALVSVNKYDLATALQQLESLLSHSKPYHGHPLSPQDIKRCTRVAEWLRHTIARRNFEAEARKLAKQRGITIGDARRVIRNPYKKKK